ncbi:MAG: 4-phosphoerythronate dehydrogenase [Fibrobacteres bacterium]|nr:4-phosphoerythronate dehydrogenase [Fibrobacterota bacterium]
MRIFVDENIPMGREAFAAHGEVTLFAGRNLKRADLSAADALLVRSVTRVDAGLLEGTPVRFVGTATIGTDHIDQAWLASQGIGFASAPGCNANSVGEYLASALTWLAAEKGFALEGKTLGIIGWGHVGKRVEAKAAGLGLKVLRNDPPLEQSGGAPGVAFVSLERLLDECDILSLHVPLIKAGPHPTLELAGPDFFARLQRPIVLCNTCRGEVIDETALRQAHAAGRIRHLVLDVFAGEPRPDPALCAIADLVTPHIAGYSLPGKLNGTTQVAAAFRACFGFPDAWAPAYPHPSEDELAYVPGSDASFLRRCIASVYDVAEDDARLRSALREADPGKGFDRLRREYPIRHEFASYQVIGLPAEKRELRSRLQALGFRIR